MEVTADVPEDIPAKFQQAAAVLSGVPITAVFLYAQRWIVEGLTAGGVKG